MEYDIEKFKSLDQMTGNSKSFAIETIYNLLLSSLSNNITTSCYFCAFEDSYRTYLKSNIVCKQKITSAKTCNDFIFSSLIVYFNRNYYC